MHPEPSRLRVHTAINLLMSLAGHPADKGGNLGWNILLTRVAISGGTSC